MASKQREWDAMLNTRRAEAAQMRTEVSMKEKALSSAKDENIVLQSQVHRRD